MLTENMSYEGILVENIHSAETRSEAKNMAYTDDEATTNCL